MGVVHCKSRLKMGWLLWVELGTTPLNCNMHPLRNVPAASQLYGKLVFLELLIDSTLEDGSSRQLFRGIRRERVVTHV